MTGSGVWHKLDLAARRSAPGATTLLLVVIGVIPTRLPYYGAVAPFLPLASVYYWTVYRPDLLSAGFVFFIGLLYGVLADAPIGLHAFVLLGTQWLLLRQRRFLATKPFVVVWAGFIGVAVAVGLAEWLFLGLYELEIVPLGPVAMRILLTAIVFPILAWLFIQLHRNFVGVAG
jgi:rod shape-determining protein MreD